MLGEYTDYHFYIPLKLNAKPQFLKCMGIMRHPYILSTQYLLCFCRGSCCTGGGGRVRGVTLVMVVMVMVMDPSPLLPPSGRTELQSVIMVLFATPAVTPNKKLYLTKQFRRILHNILLVGRQHWPRGGW